MCANSRLNQISRKPTVQLQKVFDLLDLLGLELIVRQRPSKSL